MEITRRKLFSGLAGVAAAVGLKELLPETPITSERPTQFIEPTPVITCFSNGMNGTITWYTSVNNGPDDRWGAYTFNTST